jgi:prolipoprotein diacylglyceryl transferase
MSYTWDVDPVLIHFWGDIGLRYYGLIFSLVFVLGFLLFRWQVVRAGGGEDDFYGIIIPGALGAVVGARLGHVLFYNLDRALSDPLWVFQTWTGGLASHGACLGLLAALWYYARRRKQSYLECLDRFTFSATTAAILVRIGNFINSEIVGRVTDGAWGVRFPRFDGYPAESAPLRHPSQLYEAGLGLVVMAVLYIVDHRLGGEKRPRGVLAGTFLTVYFTGRFLVEFVKERQVLPYSSPLSMGQYLSIPAVLFGLWLIYHGLRHPVPAHWNVTMPATTADGKKVANGPKGRSKAGSRGK